MAVSKEYTGWLSPYMAFIKRQYEAGVAIHKIAHGVNVLETSKRLLGQPAVGGYWCSEGSIAGLIKYALNREGVYKPVCVKPPPWAQAEARWAALVPPDIARRQAVWERGRRLAAMHDAGFTWAEIGRREGKTTSRAYQVGKSWKIGKEKGKRSPVEAYLDNTMSVRFGSLSKRAIASLALDTQRDWLRV